MFNLIRRLLRALFRPSKRATFLPRWNAACEKLWAEFRRRPVSVETLEWFERKHARLMRISANHLKAAGVWSGRARYFEP